jgi:putative ABC transport system permease protein
VRGAAGERDAIQRLRETLNSAGFDVAGATLIAERRRVVEDHLLMVASFLGGMGQLIMLVGGLGLASTMSIAVLERRREIGILRAIGARDRTILGMVQLEGLVLAGVSWVLAIPLSVPMSLVLARAFAKIMVPVPATFLPGWTGLLEWLLLVAVVSVIASSWPAWRATRVPAAEVLAYE